MSSGEKPDFPDKVLGWAESIQNGIGHTKLGGRIIEMVAGSDSAAYTQLDWFSRNVTIGQGKIYTVTGGFGDPTAGRLPRSWNRAMVMSVPVEVSDQFKASVSPEPWQEAVAYESGQAVHVGALQYGPYLFEELDQENLGIAMRIGRAALSATMGLWLPGKRTYIDFSDVEVVEPSIPVPSLDSHYADLALV